MIDVKKTIAKILEWIDGYQAPHWTYVGNVGSTIFNGTWTCPNDGIVIMHGVATSSSSNNAYWYVNDITSNIQLGTLFWVSANQTRRTTSFPVIKGHQYNTNASTRIATANAYYYRLGGVVSRLLKALQSLSYRKAVVVC